MIVVRVPLNVLEIYLTLCFVELSIHFNSYFSWVRNLFYLILPIHLADRFKSILHKMKAQKVSFSFLLIFILAVVGLRTASSQTIPTLGMASSMDNDSLLYATGFRLLGESVSKILSPSLSKEQFEDNVKKVKSTKCKVYMCNVLFPGSIKIAGPDVDEKRVLGYLDTVTANAQKAGIPVLVLGSGGARKLPEGYDKEVAKADFIKLAGKMAEVAKKHRIVIVLENLNSTETNFLNTLKDAAEVVKKTNHPNFRLNADIYHMMKENEPADEILKAKNIIEYCEVAEKDERTLPGVKGDNFIPYFSALKAINYKGPIIVEGKTKDLKKDALIAFNFLTRQLKESYSKTNK